VHLRVPWALPLVLLAAPYIAADHALASTRRAIEAGSIPPVPAEADLWYSRTLLNATSRAPDLGHRVAGMQQALAAARRATLKSEDPFNAWYNLAGILALQNDASGAEQALRNAVVARPNWFKPHWTLAQLLALEHRTAEARREALLAVDLDGGRNPEVMATVLQLQK
jgi:tetratricopeptide (TPR) repeat protein